MGFIGFFGGRVFWAGFLYQPCPPPMRKKNDFLGGKYLICEKNLYFFLYETTLIQIPVYDSFNYLLGCEEGGIILLYKTLVKKWFFKSTGRRCSD